MRKRRLAKGDGGAVSTGWSRMFAVTVTELFHSMEEGYTVDASSMFSKTDVTAVKRATLSPAYISNVARPTSLRITGNANFCRDARSRMLLPCGLLPKQIPRHSLRTETSMETSQTRYKRRLYRCDMVSENRSSPLQLIVSKDVNFSSARSAGARYLSRFPPSCR